MRSIDDKTWEFLNDGTKLNTRNVPSTQKKQNVENAMIEIGMGEEFFFFSMIFGFRRHYQSHLATRKSKAKQNSHRQEHFMFVVEIRNNSHLLSFNSFTLRFVFLAFGECALTRQHRIKIIADETKVKNLLYFFSLSLPFCSLSFASSHKIFRICFSLIRKHIVVDFQFTFLSGMLCRLRVRHIYQLVSAIWVCVHVCVHKIRRQTMTSATSSNMATNSDQDRRKNTIKKGKEEN